MEEKNTREIILMEALNLFSNKGYAAVSMRDIAMAVGIRVSSIYHHFSGKQALFEALIQKATDVKEALQDVFLNALSKAGRVEEEAFVQTGIYFLTGYLQNAQVEPLLKVLECERFHNEDADRVWKELVIFTPLEHEENVFRLLRERGEIVDATTDKELAAEYQAAIMMAYFTGDIQQLQIQLHHFYKRIFI
ncbi:MAG: TetR/AcrR family transcriptional regulator [Lachnospiraceae bacterium]|nr:TetR/AcrR family transcriptional regulator [Lachnospiraceae bacterium]